MLEEPFEPNTLILDERYRVVRPITRQAYANLFEAENIATGEHVAVRLIGEPLSTESEFLSKFLKDSQAAAKLSHPVIPVIKGMGTWDRYQYVITELVCGKSLREKLAAGVMTPEQAVAIMSPICEALQHAHDAGIVHANLSPSAIYLDDTTGNTTVKLLGFGLRRLKRRSAESRANHPVFNTMIKMYTAYYMSPELATGNKLDGRADQYSLGCILYEMLAGQRPFSGKNQIQLATQHMSASVPSIEGVSDGFNRVISKATRKDKEERYQAILELRDDLVRALNGEPVAAPIIQISSPAVAAPQPPKKLELSKGQVITIAISLICALVAIGFIYLLSPHPHAKRPGSTGVDFLDNDDRKP